MAVFAVQREHLKENEKALKNKTGQTSWPEIKSEKNQLQQQLINTMLE